MKNKPNIGKIERRTFSVDVQLRAAEKGSKSRTVEGYAAVFNTVTDMGAWRESIAPGAFDGVLQDDVRALFNHDPNMILARTNNTLEIWQDEKGLGYRFEAPDTTRGNDLLEDIRSGNVTQSSFGFTIDDYEWSEMPDGSDHLSITKLGRLFDVSPVTFPAYETTEVVARSLDAFHGEKKKPEMKKDEKRAMDVFDMVDMVSAAFYSEFDGSDDSYYYIQSVAVDNTIVAKEYPSQKLFKLSYSMTASNEVSFDEKGAWVEVQKEYMPVVRDFFGALETEKMKRDNPGPDDVEVPEKEGGPDEGQQDNHKSSLPVFAAIAEIEILESETIL